MHFPGTNNLKFVSIFLVEEVNYWFFCSQHTCMCCFYLSISNLFCNLLFAHWTSQRVAFIVKNRWVLFWLFSIFARVSWGKSLGCNIFISCYWCITVSVKFSNVLRQIETYNTFCSFNWTRNFAEYCFRIQEMVQEIFNVRL